MDRINELNAVFEKAVKEAYEKGFKNGRGITEGLSDEPVETETIEHGDLNLRKVERMVCDGDYVKVEHENGECFKPGKIYGPVIEGRVRADSSTGKDKYEEVGVYNDWYGRYESTVEIFEVVESNPVIELQDFPKSPNQQRYETIQRAREFVNSKFVEGHGGVGQVIDGISGHIKVEFFVNAEKRTVVALLTLAYTGLIRYRGISKCNPSDVFNSDIGKAIALARALEIDIPEEFLNAVRPSEFAIGQIIKYSTNSTYKITSIEDSRAFVDDCEEYAQLKDFNIYKVIDDSKSEYGDPHE